MTEAGIFLKDVGKRYNREWIFRGVNYRFREDAHTVILGPNGSGKSTLLQTILGNIVPSAGELNYAANGRHVGVEDSLGMFSVAAPYLELIEEFTLTEILEFHQKMIPFRSELTIDAIIRILYLSEAKDKTIRYYSSGMKQRVKLAIALLSDTPFVLLDEPTSNLDATAIRWYADLVEEHKKGRILIVCSNDQKDEYAFCTQQLNISDYK